jgi:two-component system, chemotaxis family, chemotaxis protein CheY
VITPTTPKPLKSARVFVVDDEPYIAQLIKRICKQSKIDKVHTAQDARELMFSVRHNFDSPDIIVSDCNMRPINGLQFLQAIRAGINPHIRRDTPFVMLTGHCESTFVSCAKLLDASGYIAKPFTTDKFLTVLGKCLARRLDPMSPEYYRELSIPARISA